ncbi:helix-turn-helix domain-containing protein [Poseidonibacter ostreae]|uniref:XRE family transcriptional regulator n=1 Tax=Poseidonibacter ostreae TaxID=2654171 RepID=A0A6L4WU42_9BACT|nr:helix-turn-helix transcriptional regulator [Poseidonibacter ostreae]KAB7889572.1 XRE family transcriptional regulator [Poseidonibacter ostreae]
MAKDAEDLNDSYIDNHYIKIGQNVARIRNLNKLSQLALSQKMGFKSTSLIAGAETYYKKQHFNIEHLIKLSYILDCDIKEFFN